MYRLKSPEKKSHGEGEKLFSQVSAILNKVRKEGDAALIEMNETFDGCRRSDIRVSKEEIAAGKGKVSSELLRSMAVAAENIRRFAQLQLATLLDLPPTEVCEGVFLGHRIIPVDSCCCYVPGGNYPLFSSALMLAIPAAVAGVSRICAVTPAARGSGAPHPAVLAALDIAGVSEIYVTGGAQAIAAAAYGTQSIAPVSMIVGPGNRYVTEAKRQVYGAVGIDFIAGPSEVLIIADESATPAVIAADLAAQCEHDSDARGILISTSRTLAEKVMDEFYKLINELGGGTAAAAWEANGEIIIADGLDEACEISNAAAPEHLEINIKNPDSVIDKLRNYGSLFIGEYSAEVFGDYVAGTNHTLPTMGAARYTGGVWAGTFLKTCSVQRISKKGAQILAPHAYLMAKNEGLSAHAAAAKARGIF